MPDVVVMPVLPRVVVMPTVVVSGPGVTTGVVAGSMPGGGSRPVTGVVVVNMSHTRPHPYPYPVKLPSRRRPVGTGHL